MNLTEEEQAEIERMRALVDPAVTALVEQLRGQGVDTNCIITGLVQRAAIEEGREFAGLPRWLWLAEFAQFLSFVAQTADETYRRTQAERHATVPAPTMVSGPGRPQ